MADTSKKLSRPTPWREVVIICRKCGKKLDGGFGHKRKESLKTLLRQALRDRGQRRSVRVFETGCMGVCPKQGVTVLNATRPDMLHVIQAGTDADEAVRTLLGGSLLGGPLVGGSLLGGHVVANESGVETA